MNDYYVYFVGTRNGQNIKAETAKEAKRKFAELEGVPVSNYIVASKGKRAAGDRV